MKRRLKDFQVLWRGVGDISPTYTFRSLYIVDFERKFKSNIEPTETWKSSRLKFRICWQSDGRDPNPI